MTAQAQQCSTVLAGVIYAVSVFAVGFILGTVRVLWLVPALGETRAVFLELPVMLTACLVLAIRVVRRCRVPARPGPRIGMGVLAFAILMVFEAGVSTLLFGNSLAGHLTHYLRPEAWPGLAGQILFGLLPLLLLWRKTRHPR